MPPILYEYLYWSSDGGPADPRSAMILLWIMIGVGVLFTGFFLVARLAGRFRTALPRALGETAAVAAAVAVLILVLAGRLPFVWTLYIAPLPAALLGYGLWEHIRQRGNSRSQVRTAWLKMVLDYDAGLFNGEVLKGRFCGSILSEMSLEELRLLLVELVSDPESVSILHAYLDHAHAGARHSESAAGGKEDNSYRASQGRHRESHMQTDGGMSEDEAWSLLGLARGASHDDIKTSYRRLMKQVHPDHGGTDYLAHKITQAKEILLGT